MNADPKWAGEARAKIADRSREYRLKQFVIRVAAMLYRDENPNKEWLSYPNTRQSAIQSRYIQRAKTLIAVIRDDYPSE